MQSHQLESQSEQPLAGVLVRVSTTRQGERGASVETQRQDCTAYCERMGWQVAMVEEDHQSGTDFDRAGFRKLADAAKQGGISKLVVYSLDRFGRGDMLSSLIELRAFEDAGCEIHSLTDGGLVKNDLMRDIRLAIAQDSSRQLSVRVSRASAYRAETGHWVALAPFGYDLIPCPDCGKGKKLSPNDQGVIVTEVAKRFDAGQTPVDIRAWLRQEHGLIVDVGWTRRRLTNPCYAGDIFYNRRHEGKFKRGAEDVIVSRDAHPALIDREAFQRIQARFQAPQAIAKATTRPYDGLVFCGACESRMYRVTGGQKGRYHYYYSCSARHRFKTCDQPQVTYGSVEAAVTVQMSERFPAEPVKQERETIFQRLMDIVEPDITRLLSGASDVRQKLQAEIEKLERQQGMVYEDRLEGHVSPDFAAKKLADIGERIKSATQELATLKSTASNDWHRSYQAHFGLRIEALAPAERELLRLLVARITVTGDTLAVDWTDYAQSLVKPTDGSLRAASTARARSGRSCRGCP